jgi:hypothetical protein
LRTDSKLRCKLLRGHGNGDAHAWCIVRDDSQVEYIADCMQSPDKLILCNSDEAKAYCAGSGHERGTPSGPTGNVFIHQIPSQLVQIHKEKIIGKGSYSVVYAGIYDGKPVVVKHLRDDIKDEDDRVDAVSHFKNEAQRLTPLSNVNIIKFIGQIIDSRDMVLEMVKGRTLLNILEENPNDLTPAYRRSILIQVGTCTIL